MNSSSQPRFISRWEPTELASTILSASGRDVVSYWISALAFLDENQHPVMLTVNRQGELTFGDLVHAVNPDFASSVVLNELLRKGVVEQLESGQVLLRRSTYVQDVPGFEKTPDVRRQNKRSERSAGRRHNDDV
ncbi:hypothetical protein [Marinobacter antarcticus]|uniref:Uncharacterized protein n=1 Tax=Marinobacter antarcticus TaxID=564117 RepID=A0A831R333_9GAMM|nr:hypothetical protein [Marinobacter antarcticus]HEA53197.1 hypothetical protein [Marinobacter antarcticus]